MRRRGATVLLGALLLAVLLWQVGEVPVPYVQVGPGPTVDTLGTNGGHRVIVVQGATTSTSAGQLRLVTVGITSDLTLLEALRGWWQSDYAVVPRELYYPPDKTEQQVEQESAQDFQVSQTSAETAALRVLGYPVQITVTGLVAGGPAEGQLAAGDIIASVDGSPVTSTHAYDKLVRAKPAGTALAFGIVHDGVTRTVTLTPVRDADGTPRIGVTAESRQPHPFEVKIDLARIGGPSAGLMFALGIIDTLDPADLTGGIIIAGTGEIDEDGNVGPIGGVPQKLLAATAAHATVFLTPAANCAEAVSHAQPGLTLVKVSTLDDALTALRALREHRQPTLCTS